MGLKPLVRPLWRLGTLLGASDRTVIITGSPRSGTTWLLEMIERATDARRIWEPFYAPDSQPEERNFGLGWRPYLSSDEDNPGVKRYLTCLLTGRGVTTGMATGAHQYSRVELARRLAAAPATVVKFCRLQRMLPWFVRRFDVPVVLLVRHPLGVVASQLEHPSWDHERADSEHLVVSGRVQRDFSELAEYAEGVDSMAEKLAATWAFDYLVPLEHWEQLDGVLLVTYEGLVESRLPVLRAILRHLDLRGGVTDAHGEEPSASTRGDSNVVQGGDPLTTWQRRLDETQIQQILSVVRRFGITMYDEAPTPDTSRLPARRTAQDTRDREKKASGTEPDAPPTPGSAR